MRYFNLNIFIFCNLYIIYQLNNKNISLSVMKAPSPSPAANTTVQILNSSSKSPNILVSIYLIDQNSNFSQNTDTNKKMSIIRN